MPIAGTPSTTGLFAEMEYVEPLHAILAWDKHSPAMGFIAADEKPSGFLTARIDFSAEREVSGRRGALETLAFSAAQRYAGPSDA
jgi:hypothetical protein